jgi:hypothetical protein
MKLRFEVDQAESFRLGVDRPKSIVSIEVNPADVPQEAREIIANHLVGIDVVELFYNNGDIIKGHWLKELTFTTREPKRIVASGVNLESLLSAISRNDACIQRIRESFNRPVSLRQIDKAPKDEDDFVYFQAIPPDFLEICKALQQKQAVCFECFIHDIQNKLNQLLNEHSYQVDLLLLPPSTATGRFYCRPVFSGEALGRTVISHSPVIVLNEKSGHVVEASNLFHALQIYFFSQQPGMITADDLTIRKWEHGRWTIFAPEGIIQMEKTAAA